MEYSYLYILIIGLIIYRIFSDLLISSQNTQKRLKILDRKNTEILLELNRFNTKSERFTSYRIAEEQLYFETDLQAFQLANWNLISKISSEINNQPVLFDILISPFEKELFEMEGYQNFNQDGILIIGTHGIISRQILEQVVPLEHLAKRITFEPQATMLQLHTFKVDKAENAIHLIGNFEDGNNFAVKIDYLNFRMYIEAPIASLLNEENFKLFDFSETKNEN